MTKAVLSIIIAGLIFAAGQNLSAQKTDSPKKEKTKTPAVSVENANDNDEEFYANSLLKSDLQESDVVAYVKVLSYELADQIGQGGCAENKGAGYCLYLLKAEIKEVFKGKLARKTFEFYKVTEAGYAHKEKMIGEHVIFLKWSENFPGKKRSLGTIENSTRDLKHDVLAKLRKIARLSNRKS